MVIRVKDKPGDNAMYVKRLLPAAREKLVIIAADAPLMEAANLLHKGTDLVIVCDSAGLVAGVITKSDVVGQMSRCQGASCTMAASLTMTRDVVTCRPDELLQEVWKRMKERKLKNISVVDKDARPLVLNNDNKTRATVQKNTDDLHDRSLNAFDRRVFYFVAGGRRRSAR